MNYRRWQPKRAKRTQPINFYVVTERIILLKTSGIQKPSTLWLYFMIRFWWTEPPDLITGNESERNWRFGKAPKNYKVRVILARLKFLELLFGNPINRSLIFRGSAFSELLYAYAMILTPEAPQAKILMFFLVFLCFLLPEIVFQAVFITKRC